MAGQGAAIGGAAGSIAGSLIPGVGTAVGGMAGSSLGSFIDSVVAKRGAESATPPMQDPNQLLLLDEIERRRKAMEEGTDTASQVGMKSAEETGAATRDALSRATGGNVSATVDALLKSQRMEDTAKGQAMAGSQAKLPYYQGLIEQLNDKIAQRTLDLTQFNRVNKNAQEAQFGKEALMNFMAGNATGQFDPLTEGAGQGLAAGGNKLIEFLQNQLGGFASDRKTAADVNLFNQSNENMKNMMDQIFKYKSLPGQTQDVLNNPTLAIPF